MSEPAPWKSTTSGTRLATGCGGRCTRNSRVAPATGSWCLFVPGVYAALGVQAVSAVVLVADAVGFGPVDSAPDELEQPLAANAVMNVSASEPAIRVGARQDDRGRGMGRHRRAQPAPSPIVWVLACTMSWTASLRGIPPRNCAA